MFSAYDDSILKQVCADVIRYPRYRELQSLMAECYGQSTIATEPRCMSIEGVSGVGKTLLVRDYVANSPPLVDENGVCRQVLYLTVPAPASREGTIYAMLRKLGGWTESREKSREASSRLIKYLSASAIGQVIMDDFHHYVSITRDRDRAEVAEWLLQVVDEARVCLVVVGLEGEVQPILDMNPQISRLFSSRETLKPFVWDESDERHRQELSDFVLRVFTLLGISLPSNTRTEDLIRRIYYATGGVAAHVVNLLRYASQLGREMGESTLTASRLSQAFKARLNHVSLKANPFEV